MLISPNHKFFRELAYQTLAPRLCQFYAPELLLGDELKIGTAAYNTGCPQPVYAEDGGPCVVMPPRCDCHVIGGNTLGTSGIPTTNQSARFHNLQIDAGDADTFKPVALFVVAYQVDGGAPTEQITGDQLPMLIADVQSGRQTNMRRSSTSDPSYGIVTTIYGEDKVLECVNWKEFGSIDNQKLTIVLFNMNDVTVHAFCDIWGTPLVA